MDETTKDLDLSLEEQKAEAEISKEVNEDEIRERLAEELGVDPDEQSDLLEKLVEREKSYHERLSGAIKQKINWRTKAQASEKTQSKSVESKSRSEELPDIEEVVERKLAERLEARELESLNLSDDLKTEVKDLAKLKGISVREAAQLPYIKSRVEEVEREERVKAAIPKRSNKGSYATSFDPSKPLDPEDFDFNSEEGIKAWKEARAARAKHNAQNA